MRANRLCFLLCVSVLAACDESPTRSAEAPSLEMSLMQVDPWMQGSMPEVLRGDLTIQSRDDAVVVAVDRAQGLKVPDGIVDHVLVLQMGAAPAPVPPTVIHGGTVYPVFRGAVVSDSRGKRVFGISIPRLDGSDPLADVADRLDTRWHGLGLSRRGGQWKLEGQLLPAAAMADIISRSCGRKAGAGGATALNDPSGECTSGGPGASSCSTGCWRTPDVPCSVECSSGYACCDAENCRCTCQGISG